MDASPLLARIAKLLGRHSLEGTGGQRHRGPGGRPRHHHRLRLPLRKTPANLRKLKAIATELEAVILTPYYPVSGLYRICRDADGLQLDFMTVIDGIRWFEALRGRARAVRFGNASLRSRTWLISSGARRRPPGPPTRRPCRRWRKLAEMSHHPKGRLAALKKESDAALRDQIRRLLGGCPSNAAAHFLRKRVGFRMSCL